jgi:hypothetical protein
MGSDSARATACWSQQRVGQGSALSSRRRHRGQSQWDQYSRPLRHLGPLYLYGVPRDVLSPQYAGKDCELFVAHRRTEFLNFTGALDRVEVTLGRAVPYKARSYQFEHARAASCIRPIVKFPPSRPFAKNPKSAPGVGFRGPYSLQDHDLEPRRPESQADLCSLPQRAGQRAQLLAYCPLVGITTHRGLTLSCSRAR